MKLDSLHKLFVHELKDLYSAEKQIVRAFPKFIRAVSNDDLKQAMQGHQKESRQQVQRLEHIFSKLEFSPGGHRCKAMAGLLREAKSLLKEDDIEPEVLDAGMIAAMQRVEHYEIAAYGTARAYAEKLGQTAAAELLQETLEEESATDEKLTRLAEDHINADAMAVESEVNVSV